MRSAQNGNSLGKFGSENTPVLGRSFRRPCDLFVVSPPVTGLGLAPDHRPSRPQKKPGPHDRRRASHFSAPPTGQKQGRERKTLGGVSIRTTNLQAVFPKEVVEVVGPILGLGQRLL